jgi:hypothetical protein
VRRLGILVALAAPLAAGAEQPADFLFSAPIATESTASHYRITLPAQSYRGAVRRDLGDLRVFNAAGEPVPYAFVQRDIPRPPPTMQPVKLFPLYGYEAKGLDATSVRVERNARGTVVSVSVNERAGGKGRRLLGYLLDPGEIKAAKEALLLGWDTPEGFTGQARVESSDDLKSWYPITTNAPILSLQHAGASLERSRVEIPGARGRYLRLSLTGVPERFVLKEIRVELRPEVAPPAREWLALNGTAGKSSGEWLFDTGGHFPVDRVRLRLPQPNTVTQVQLLTRERMEDNWRPAASGIAYRLSASGADIVNPDIAVGAKSDRYWLVRVEQRGGGVGAGELGLDIGWLPQEVVFAARGAAPFTVGFGSEKHTPGALPLAAVLPRRPDGEPVDVSVAKVGAVSGVAEEPALLSEPLRYVQRLAARRDVKKWGLWTALVAGVLLLGWMALRLLRDVGRQP